MSKRSAKKWSAEIQKKDPNKKNLNETLEEKSYSIKLEDTGKTLEAVVAKYFGIPSNLARLKIVNKEVWVSNSMASSYTDLKPKGIVKFGDKLCILAPKFKTKSELLAEEQKFVKILKESVIYKDEKIIVLNKWNTATHGGSKHNHLNIADFLHKLGNDKEIPRLVHRLDKGTTGCLVLARSAKVANELSTMFQNHNQILKRYVAVVIPPLTEFNRAFQPGYSESIVTGITIEKGADQRERAQIVPWNDSFTGPTFSDIKRAETKVMVLKSSKLCSLVCLMPSTGRKHQLRVHMNHYNSFILGDYKYGPGCTKKYRHQISDPTKIPIHLHFYNLRIPNWYGEGKDLNISAPPPLFWTKTLKSSGIDPNLISRCSELDIILPSKPVQALTDAEDRLFKFDF